MNSHLNGKQSLLPNRKVMLFLSFIFVLFSTQKLEIFAQSSQKNIKQQNDTISTRTITGVVSDDQGPLPGAAVLVKGTSIGVVADDLGAFSIEVPMDKTILVINSFGAETKEIRIGEQSHYLITLEANSSIKEVEGVMVYGKKIDKRSYTGALNRVSGRSIAKRKIKDYSKPGIRYSSYKQSVNVSEKLIGKNGNNIEYSKPFIVVDGAPFTGDLNKMNPNDIQDLKVLKSQDAAALYGSRATSGAIIIETQNRKLSTILKANKFNKKFRSNRMNAERLGWNKFYKEQNPNYNDNSNESYEAFEENAFTSPLNQPLSTFSIDVDRAAYSNIRRLLNKGSKVPKDAVRIEEMINYFSYNYGQPASSRPFGLYTEIAVAPWNPKHQLLKIGLQAKETPTALLPSSNLVFLIDVSGSMNEENKLPLLKKAFGLLVRNLREQDKVSIVVYAGAAGMILPPTSGADKGIILDALEQMRAGGSTAGGAGIELAYKIARENFVEGGNNRVILATDGDFNVGASSDDDMQRLIEERRKDGVFLTCLGFGMGNYKDSKLELLANKGNGNHAYIDDDAEAQKILQNEFGATLFTVAKDVKIQIEFNSALVASYRLIGYENRILNAEDFVNDAVDAGDMGSGHSVTVLYEIIPTGINSSFMPNVEPLKYTKVEKDKTNFNSELAQIKYRFKLPDAKKSTEYVQTIESKFVAESGVSQGFKLATAVAWFGLYLRDSKLIAQNDLNSIKKYVGAAVVKNDKEQLEFEMLVDKL